jgi:hypothetical protein
VRTPYIIVGQPNDLSTPDDDTGAALVTFTARGDIALAVSTDQGRHWEKVWSGALVGERRFDLTKWVAGRYEYHVRLTLAGNPRTASLGALRLGTWTQLAPASLPRLTRGLNRLSFVWGDRRREPTEMASLEPNFSDPADLQRWGVETDGKYDPADVSARVRGPVTLQVTAPPGQELRWLHVGGSFNAHHGDAKQPDRLLFSLDPSTGWKLLRQERPPDWVQHWYYNLESDLELSRPAPSVWLRLDPAVAVNGLRVYTHSAREDAEQLGPVLVTHTYRAGGKEHRASFRFAKPQPYEIFCEDDPENVTVTMSVPSRKK